MTKNKGLALFDFDGTITRRDTLFEFIKFAHSKRGFYRGMFWLSPILILHVLRLLGNDRAKRMVLKHFFHRWYYDTFKETGEDFCKEILPAMIRPSALKKLNWHKEQQHRIIVVSASIHEWVEPWCRSIGVEVACTRMEVIDKVLTGKYSGNNCYGPEKMNRINAMLKLSDYTEVYAYGDSSGDKQMLEAAQHPHFKEFND